MNQLGRTYYHCTLPESLSKSVLPPVSDATPRTRWSPTKASFWCPFSEEEVTALLEQAEGPDQQFVERELSRQETGCPPSEDEIQQALDGQELQDDIEPDEDSPYSPSDYWAGMARDEDGD